ncbi:hypothetical protein OOZ15_12650 [Galbibacter sp. EGI 63066]|uniref:hypothetical protein n=1 Tax=Galbibacter sp. EGI 63066 TaxID=2993559 RepID=UPI002248EBC6|nr:hypothetical protein [Galbibacter sp. EGI 63066]MCX2680795.1 hypothetical protein [Galbibacter sp. EGI 63066]
MSFKKIISAVFAIALLAVSAVSCSPNSVADEDSLYDNHQGVEKAKIVMPSNG